MKRIQLGVIGLGLIWLREHKHLLADLADQIEPVAFCDLSPQRRAETAAAYPGAPVLDDPAALMALPDLDAVLVLTPIALNAPTAHAALAAGKHVIMEKPIARSVAEGQALIEFAQAQGKRLFVTEQLAYRQAETTLAALLAAGEIGEPVLWERVQHFEGDSAQGPLSYASTPWRQNADFPLGTLFDGGIHLIASLTKVFGAPQRVSATGRKLRAGYGEYDQVSMLFGYENGMTGMLSHSTCLPTLQNHFHIHGSDGVISVDADSILVERQGQPARQIPMPPENRRAPMWQAIVHAYVEGGDPYYTPQRALQDVAILEGVERAIKHQQWVDVVKTS